MTDNVEEYPGHEIERDTDGKIKKHKLSSSEARRMARKRWNKKGNDRAAELLKDRGIDPETADAGLKSLAEIATSGRSGAVTSMKYLDRLTGYFDDSETDTSLRSVEFVDKSENLAIINYHHYIKVTPEFAANVLPELKQAIKERVKRQKHDKGATR